VVNNLKIKIADINININGDINQFFINRVTNYIVTRNNAECHPMGVQNAELNITDQQCGEHIVRVPKNDDQIEINFTICDYIEKPTGKLIATKDDRTWLYNENGDFCYFDYNDYFKKCVFTTTIQAKNKSNTTAQRIQCVPYTQLVESSPIRVDIKFYNFCTKEEFEFLNNALREKKKNEPNPKYREHTDITNYDYALLNSIDQCLRYVLLNFNALIIHSSSIHYNGDGIIFSAPSGTGKTTHTNLWKARYPEVEIINDDSPIIHIKKNEDESGNHYKNSAFVCGSPWAGASGINTNIIVPLKAIVFLEQAPTDSIEKLSPMLALSKLLNEIAKPVDKDLMDKTFDLINILLTNIPCYLLKCTPTDKAVETVWNELYNKEII
jgi:hypothetical protein